MQALAADFGSTSQAACTRPPGGRTNCQHARIEGPCRQLGVGQRLAARESVRDAALPHKLDERRPLLVANRPELLIGNGVYRCPTSRIGRAALPVRPHVTRKQLAEGIVDPGGAVYPIGDVADRDGFALPIGPERLPHRAGDLAMATTDRIGGSAYAQCQLGHTESLPAVRRSE